MTILFDRVVIAKANRELPRIRIAHYGGFLARDHNDKWVNCTSPEAKSMTPKALIMRAVKLLDGEISMPRVNISINALETIVSPYHLHNRITKQELGRVFGKLLRDGVEEYGDD